jgi:hypothetical protein
MVAVVTELRKLGATVEEGRDYCVITPPAKVCVCVCVCVWWRAIEVLLYKLTLPEPMALGRVRMVRSI